MLIMRALIVLLLACLTLFCQRSNAWTHGSGSIIPTPAVRCVISGTVNGVNAGNCIGTGGGSSLFTAATCDGVADDAAAFISFNTWATTTWQASHSGLIELDIQSGKTCEWLSGTVNTNVISYGIKSFQIVGYGASMGDGVGHTGGGFFLGGVASAMFFDNAHTARLATVTAGSSSITLLNTALCSLFNNGDSTLIAALDPQGFGDPPNPQQFEWVTITSTASCAGSGVVTLSAPLAYTYKSTWPVYNAGDSGHSDNGGPGTLYALDQRWVTTQAYYGITINQGGAASNSAGKDITFRDVTWLGGNGCSIPSQNLYWRVINGTGVGCTIEFDKVVSNIVMQTVTYRRLLAQSSQITNWSCTNCTVGPIGVSGTVKTTSFVNSALSQLQVGATSYGNSGSLSITNTAIASLFTGGSSSNLIDKRGVWSTGTLTIPSNMSVSSATNNGGLIRLTVNSTAGWATGIVGGGSGNCAGDYAVTVIDSTHVDLQGSTFSGDCAGTTFGNLPMTWAVPGANVMFDGGVSAGAPSGPVLQVADLAVGANNATVITFNQNGSPYAGAFPTMAGTIFSVTSHPAPSLTASGITGALNATDINGLSSVPFGSQATRTITSANTGSDPAMSSFGPLHEVDTTVTAACGGASNIDLSQFVVTLNSSAAVRLWPPTVNGVIASATPRVITPTTSSGAQSGDSLVTPGASTELLTGQAIPTFTSPGNCGSASATVTIKTDQGVVFP